MRKDNKEMICKECAKNYELGRSDQRVVDIDNLKIRELVKKINITYVLGILRLHEVETPAKENSYILADINRLLEKK